MQLSLHFEIQFENYPQVIFHKIDARLLNSTIMQEERPELRSKHVPAGGTRALLP